MSDADTKSWIHLGGLPREFTEGDILCICSQFGEITALALSRDADNESRGFCFIKYEDDKSCDIAVNKLNNISLLGNKLIVSHAHGGQANSFVNREIPVVENVDLKGPNNDDDDDDSWVPGHDDDLITAIRNEQLNKPDCLSNYISISPVKDKPKNTCRQGTPTRETNSSSEEFYSKTLEHRSQKQTLTNGVESGHGKSSSPRQSRSHRHRSSTPESRRDLYSSYSSRHRSSSRQSPQQKSQDTRSPQRRYRSPVSPARRPYRRPTSPYRAIYSDRHRDSYSPRRHHHSPIDARSYRRSDLRAHSPVRSHRRLRSRSRSPVITRSHRRSESRSRSPVIQRSHLRRSESRPRSPVVPRSHSRRSESRGRSPVDSRSYRRHETHHRTSYTPSREYSRHHYEHNERQSRSRHKSPQTDQHKARERSPLLDIYLSSRARSKSCHRERSPHHRSNSSYSSREPSVDRLNHLSAIRQDENLGTNGISKFIEERLSKHFVKEGC